VLYRELTTQATEYKQALVKCHFVQLCKDCNFYNAVTVSASKYYTVCNVKYQKCLKFINSKMKCFVSKILQVVNYLHFQKYISSSENIVSCLTVGPVEQCSVCSKRKRLFQHAWSELPHEHPLHWRSVRKNPVCLISGTISNR